jgi:hypothetical protein
MSDRRFDLPPCRPCFMLHSVSVNHMISNKYNWNLSAFVCLVSLEVRWQTLWMVSIKFLSMSELLVFNLIKTKVQQIGKKTSLFTYNSSISFEWNIKVTQKSKSKFNKHRRGRLGINQIIIFCYKTVYIFVAEFWFRTKDV